MGFLVKLFTIVRWVVYLALTIAAAFLGLILLYLIVCFTDMQSYPASYQVHLQPKIIKQGDTIHLIYTRLYRFKLCQVTRTIRVLTYNDNRIYSYMQELTPTKLGVNNDVDIPIKTSDDIATGPAKLTLTSRSVCPNNILEKYWPVVRTIDQNFTITDK